jgi:hypothetical protein
VVGGYEDSPDNKYRLYVRTFGAYGHAFADNTTKNLQISIFPKDHQRTPLFTKEYRIRGSFMCCSSLWDKENNIRVIVYDYGPGVVAASGFPTNHLRTLSFRFASETGTFMEQETGGYMLEVVLISCAGFLGVGLLIIAKRRFKQSRPGKLDGI